MTSSMVELTIRLVWACKRLDLQWRNKGVAHCWVRIMRLFTTGPTNKASGLQLSDRTQRAWACLNHKCTRSTACCEAKERGDLPLLS